VHPLGELSVQQRVVPLGITIDRFGNTTPAGDRRFTVELTGLVGQGAAQPVLDFFAPAQFLDMPDASKLRRPSFEMMQAGVRLGGGLRFGGETDEALAGDAPIEFETIIPGVDDEPELTPLEVDEDELHERILVEAFPPPRATHGQREVRRGAAPRGRGEGAVRGGEHTRPDSGCTPRCR
jgi:hypothetical protein